MGITYGEAEWLYCMPEWTLCIKLPVLYITSPNQPIRWKKMKRFRDNSKTRPMVFMRWGQDSPTQCTPLSITLSATPPHHGVSTSSRARCQGTALGSSGIGTGTGSYQTLIAPIGRWVKWGKWMFANSSARASAQQIINNMWKSPWKSMKMAFKGTTLRGALPRITPGRRRENHR